MHFTRSGPARCALRQFGLAALLALLLLSGRALAITPQQVVDGLVHGPDTIVLVRDLGSGRVVASHGGALARRIRLLPGSALKPFSALILLQHHIITAQDRLWCTRVVAGYGERFACTHPRPTRPWNVVDALAWSCNSFFLTVARRLPRQELLEGLRDFGLTPDEPEAASADVGLMAIGAAAVHVTPWELLNAYTRLVRRGNGTAAGRVVLRGLRQCVARGTGQAAAVRGWSVSGKTGTMPERAGGETHAWFAGFAPSEHPRWLVLVAVARGDAATSAAVIAGHLLAGLHRVKLAGRGNLETPRAERATKAGNRLPPRLLPVVQAQRRQPPSSALPLAPPRIRRLAAETVRLQLLTGRQVRSVGLRAGHALDVRLGSRDFSAPGRLRVTWTPDGLGLEGLPGHSNWKGNSLTIAASPSFQVAAGGHLLRLRGQMELRRLPRGLELIARMPLEEYVAGAVSAEAGDMPMAAERVMAILVRTWAIENRGRHRRQGFDFCSTTHCEAWHMHRPLYRARLATRQTRGEALEYHGRLAEIFYSADCGGVTAPGSDFVRGAPYLASHPDPWCRWSPNTNWTRVIPKSVLRKLLIRAGWLTASSPGFRLRIARKDRSGRVLSLAVTGTATRIVPGPAFRFLIDRSLGWNSLKSTLFTLADTGSAIRFEGHGLGHGTGLCEDGAIGMARAGRDERQILQFYFPGTNLAQAEPADGIDPSIPCPECGHAAVRWPRLRPTARVLPAVFRAAPRLRASVPHLLLADWVPAPGWHFASDGPCRLRYQGRLPQLVLRLCPQLVGEAESRLQVPLWRPLSITVYPGMAAFIRATGRPGWVAAATRGHRIALPPLEILEQHRSLAAVLRHEIFHVLLDEHRAAGATLCLEEGAVLYYAGEAGRLRAAPIAGDARGLSEILAAPRSRHEHRQALAACAARVSGLVRKRGEAALRRRLLAAGSERK